MNQYMTTVDPGDEPVVGTFKRCVFVKCAYIICVLHV